MLQLNRKGNEVYFGEKKLTIVAQATKGPGKEVVRIDGLEGSNGQKFISLSRLKEGLNTIECTAREVTTTTTQSYQLTPEEAAEVKKHKEAIEAIISAAKARYVARPKLLTADQVKAMPEAERNAYLDKLEAYVKSVKG